MGELPLLFLFACYLYNHAVADVDDNEELCLRVGGGGGMHSSLGALQSVATHLAGRYFSHTQRARISTVVMAAAGAAAPFGGGAARKSATI